MRPEKLTKKTDKSNIGLSVFITIFATDEDNRQHWGVTCERNPRLKHKQSIPMDALLFLFLTALLSCFAYCPLVDIAFTLSPLFNVLFSDLL